MTAVLTGRTNRTAWYNEHDPYAAAWLRNLIAAGLIAPGDVDERDIRDVRPDDLRGYRQCHFFAGIAGWSYALRLAGWPDDRPVWTGSCPCQPWSIANPQARGAGDARHLWPDWFRLIHACRPALVVGEQVARAAGRGWWDEVAGDLEGCGYACRAIVVPAAACDAPHRRERLWFLADAGGARLAPPEREALRGERRRQEGRPATGGGRWPAEPDVGRVAHGLPGRVDQLRALGNAIVPQVAAEVLAAYLAGPRSAVAAADLL